MFQKSLSLQYMLILLFLVLGISLPCSALPPSERIYDSGNTANWVLGDFNGDNKVDMVSVRQLDRAGHGFHAQIDVAFGSAGSQPVIAPLPFTPDFEIALSDLDGDGDLDIVIRRPAIMLETAKSNDSRLGVWINDSHGAFTESSPEKFPLRNEVRSSEPPDFSSYSQDIDIQQLRYWLEYTGFAASGIPMSISTRVPRTVEISSQLQTDSGPRQLRAPPSSSTI